MPIVPMVDSPSVAQEPLPGRPHPALDENLPNAAFGAPIGQGIEDLGTAGSAEKERLKNAASAEEDRLKQQNDHLRVLDANTQLEAGMNALTYGKPDENGNLIGGAYSVHGQAAVNMPATFLPRYDELAKGISATLTPDQQRLFQAHIDLGKTSLNTSLSRYEYDEANRYASTVFKNGLNQYSENASLGWRDPDQIAKAKLDIKGAITIQGDREGWDSKMRAGALQTALAQLNYSVVDRMLADGQPKAALDYFVGTQGKPGIRDSNELSGEQAHQLGAQIDSALRANQSQDLAAFQVRIRDLNAFVMTNGYAPPNQMPTDEEGSRVLGAGWPAAKAQLNQNITLGADIKRVSGMPPDKQQALIESYKPTSVTGAADMIERQNILTQAVAQDRARRAADPQQYLIDNRLSVSKPLDFTKMDEVGTQLRARLAASATQSTQLGVYVPPLTKAETAAFSNALTSQTPKDRVINLGKLFTAIGDDKDSQAVMHQILPNSPVTAIVGTRIVMNDPTIKPSWFNGKFTRPLFDSETVLTGEALLNPQGQEKGGLEKTGKPETRLPPDEGFAGLRASFDTKVGTLFRGRPELAVAQYGAFKAAYLGLSSKAGDFSANVNSNRVNEAAQMTVGTVVHFNGGTVAAPPGMDPTQVQGRIHNSLAAIGKQANLEDVWQQRLAGYLPVEVGAVGSGVYKFRSGDTWAQNPSGNGVLQVDLNQDAANSSSPRGELVPKTSPPAMVTPPPPKPQGRSPRAPAIPTGSRSRSNPSQGAPTT